MKNILLLKWLARVIASLSLIFTSYHFSVVIQDLFHKLQLTRLESAQQLIVPTMFTLLSLLALYIAIKAKQDKGRYLYAIFIALYSLSDGWFYGWIEPESVRILAICLEGALAGVMFINANQYFPAPVTKHTIAKAIRNRILSGLLKWLLYKKRLWLIGFPLTFTIFAASIFIGFSTLLINLIIIVLGVCYLYINYSKSSISSRNSILWLFWGVICYIILLIFTAMLNAFTEVGPFMTVLISLLRALVLLSMLFMSIFFANSFDTGFVITRTILDGSLFLIAVLVYNIAEHYVLHTLSHYLHINDAFISSLLSGFMVLLISPLHHRLQAFLTKRFKRDTTGVSHQ